MRAFTALSLVATAAFSLFAAASPVAVQEKREVYGLAHIFAGAEAKLQPICAELNAFTAENIEVEVVTNLVVEIKDILAEAVVDVKALVGVSTEIIFAPTVGAVLLTVHDVAGLVAGLLILVSGTLYKVLGLLHYDLAVLGSVLAALGATVYALLAAVIVVVEGLVVVLVPLLGADIAVILKTLSFINIAALLKIQL